MIMRTYLTVNIETYISYFSNVDVELKSKCLSFFHFNVNSPSKYFDNFNHLINELKSEFYILGILEPRIFSR